MAYGADIYDVFYALEEFDKSKLLTMPKDDLLSICVRLLCSDPTDVDSNRLRNILIDPNNEPFSLSDGAVIDQNILITNRADNENHTLV